VPLEGEKLAVATALVEEKLKVGNIEPTHSLWNTRIVVIRKKIRKMEALTGLKSYQDSNAANGGTPACPSLTHAIPLIIVFAFLILKFFFFFFAIPLHSKVREKFAFTLPSQNHWGHRHQFQGTLLPQGMAYSSVMCQEFVAAAIEPTCCKYPEVYVLPYMKDILMSHPSESMLSPILEGLAKDLEAWGLCNAPEKVQKNASLSIFKSSYRCILDPASEGRDQKG
jgi:hypothetical protein